MFDKPGEPHVPPTEPAYPPSGPGSGYAPAGAPWPPAPAQAPATGGRARGAAAAAVLALVVTVAGVFALPLGSYPFMDVGYVEVRTAAAITSRAPRNVAFSGLAEFWWRYGALIALGATALVVAGVVLFPAAARVLGWVVGALGVAGGVLFGVALGQSADYRLVVEYGGRRTLDMYEKAGIGVWVAFVGFGLLAVTGVLVALFGRTQRVRTAPGTPGATPPPPPTWPAAPPR